VGAVKGRAGKRAESTGLSVALDILPLAGDKTGVGRFCAGLVGALIGRDALEVRGYAVARHARAEMTVPAERAGLAVRTWDIPARFANAVWMRASLAPIEWLVGDVDVVHGTNYVVPPTRRAARVVTVHDLTAVRYPQLCLPASLAYPQLVKKAAGQGAFVHVPSRFVGEEVVELLGVEAERVRVVPHGVERRAIEPGPVAGRPSKPLAPKAPYVLALGAVEPRKDLPSLVTAFAELAADNDDFVLVVAGPPGWGEAAFAAAVARAGVAPRVVRLGYLEEGERQALLCGAAVLAYPSLYEGFGFPPLEAMAAGVPVVATAAGAVPEVVGDAAELVAPGDPAALAGALARVIGDEALRATLIAKGRARAASFTWAASAAGMLELYREAALEGTR